MATVASTLVAAISSTLMAAIPSMPPVLSKLDEAMIIVDLISAMVIIIS